MLLARSCNAFSAAASLCVSGFFVETYNSARVGLETGWLSLILRRDADKAMEWLTLVPSDTSMELAEKRYRSTYGSPAWIRKEVSPHGKEQRDNLYQVLSTKSHANVASAFFMCQSESDPNDLCLYGPGPLDSEQHRCKHLRGIFYCLNSLLCDIQTQCGVDLGVTWRHDEMDLFNIAGVGYPDKDTVVKVVPKKVNTAYQALILMKLAKLQQNSAQ
jgi:ribonucleotide reductase alpha subunit